MLPLEQPTLYYAGMPRGKSKQLIGQRFGRLLVKAKAGLRNTKVLWLCECDCGNTVEVVGPHLYQGTTQSCGCLVLPALRAGSTTHGLHRSPEWMSWQAMLSRCRNPKNKSYARYGGRGITVAPEFLTLEGFVAYMGKRPPGTSLDRFPNNDGNYEPGNVRWATMTKQRRNTGSNRQVTFRGRTQALAAWCEELGLNYPAVWKRISKYRWTIERALTETT